MTTVIGYLRVSTREQADSGAGLDAQRSAISDEAERRGWQVVWVEDRGVSAKSMARPGIQTALTMLKRREASALVVSKLDRLSRSVLDFAGTMATAQKQGWALVALDLVDTTTPAGELMANVMASFAQFERRLIGQRTRDALAERKAAGVRLGRERMASPEVVARIVAAVVAGQTLARIAADLNADAVPPVNGGARWYPNTVRRIAINERVRAESAA